jgi:hypothetical protein
MPFIPHTEADIREMLAVIGVESIEALFDEIPSELRSGEFTGIPPGVSEMAMARRMRDRARQDGEPICFLGAGAYDHHIPAAVWQIANRGEFLTAYTPYQPEASQGTLQLLYEFQSMLVALTGLDAANASLYDGASALAEAVLMAVRLCRSGARRVLMPRSLNPRYRQVVRTLVSGQGIERAFADGYAISPPIDFGDFSMGSIISTATADPPDHVLERCAVAGVPVLLGTGPALRALQHPVLDRSEEWGPGPRVRKGRCSLSLARCNRFISKTTVKGTSTTCASWWSNGSVPRASPRRSPPGGSSSGRCASRSSRC